MTDKKNAVILISGRGSNMATLIEAAQQPDYPAQIVGVLSNRPQAPGLEIAQNAGIEAIGLDHKAYETREAFDEALLERVLSFQPDIVVLAGYMRLLSAPFVEALEGKLINIHPSLLPKYKGLNTHQRALDAGDAQHGCSVHFVTEDLDDGPVIAQAKLNIEPGEKADALQARVLKLEHQLYPKALAMVATGEARFSVAPSPSGAQ